MTSGSGHSKKAIIFEIDPFLFQDEPKSIHLPGIRHQAEKLEAKQKELEYWQSHLVVNDPRQYFHRLLPQTEMTESGFYSSNQVC